VLRGKHLSMPCMRPTVQDRSDDPIQTSNVFIHEGEGRHDE
jgi:hypothetical protein